MTLDAPLRFDDRGRPAQAGADERVRDLIRAVLFTEPGERVNRPDFGCALRTLVFLPNSDVLAGATRTLILASLQRWLEREVVVRDVSVENDDATLRIRMVYVRRDTGQVHDDIFEATR